MAGYLLDTNHASPLVTIGHPLRSTILASLESGYTFGLCVPVIVETKFGIGILPKAKSNLEEWQRLRSRLTLYALDANDAEAAVDLQLYSALNENRSFPAVQNSGSHFNRSIALRISGWQLASFDALIATVALKYNLTLLTTDRDFLAVDGLHCENWLAALKRS